MEKKQHLHEGHRQRLKERFVAQGLEGFAPHNILELILFYSIPRKDTNELAHTLINTFGSFQGVFEADYEELLKVPGIKENTATLIKLIPAVARQYALEKHDTLVFKSADKVGEYFVDKFFGEKHEIVYMMLLNANLEMLACVKLHEGSVNSSQVSERQIVDHIVKYNASSIILAHNHPGGSYYPSMEDIQTTAHLTSVAQMLDVQLLEHFVISGTEYIPIIHTTDSLCMHNKPNRDFFRRSKYVDYDGLDMDND